MGYLNLATIRRCTESEGPGKRFAIWCQGCLKRCRNCCNTDMQELKRQSVITNSDLISLIDKSVEEYGIEGITLMGGEPILQAEGLAEVAIWCQRNNLSVILFTGYLFEELRVMENPHVSLLIKNTDLIIDGPYIESEYDDTRNWIGSRNQKVITLSDRYPASIALESQNRSMELLISDKDILINGWPF